MAERNPHNNDAVGASKPPDLDVKRAAADQLEEIHQYLRDQYASRDVVARTVTRSGQEIDWVPIESQTADGLIATPPDDAIAEIPYDPDRPTDRVPLDLELPDAELGPPGTVPLLRVPIDAIRPDGNLQDWLAKGRRANPAMMRQAYTTRRIDDDFHVHASAAEFGTFFGTEGFINVWRPYVEWSDEFSLGQLWVQRGVSTQLQSVEAGIQVYKDKYGDWEPHIFLYHTTNGYAANGNNIGGYADKVKGWVQTSQTVFPGAKVSSHSQIGGSQYEMDFKVQFQLGFWWMKANGHWMGYYPNSLFAATGLKDQSEVVLWGGEVLDVTAHPGTTQTDMASGLFPWEGFGRTGYMRNLMNQTDQIGTMAQYQGVPSADSSDCYDIKADFSGTGIWGSHFFWGGAGRNPACP